MRPSAAADSVHSIVSNHLLTLSLGSLNVATTMTMSGGLAVSGGKLLHATICGSRFRSQHRLQPPADPLAWIAERRHDDDDERRARGERRQTAACDHQRQ